jgi:hypothetical protein
MVKYGKVNIELPLCQDEDKVEIDTLEEGSCFCLFSSFNVEKVSKVSFRCEKNCCIEMISTEDILKLEN